MLPWLAAAFALGLVAGSFLNVVIYRGPRLWGLIDGELRGDLALPRSYCPACKAQIHWTGLIPLVSFFAQRGKCRSCGATIALRYPIVEALGGAVALTSLAVLGPSWAGLTVAIFGWALVALAFIDLETGYLPNAITLPLIAAGLIANASGLFIPLADAVIGAAAGYIVFRVIGALYQSMRDRDGLGQGDAKLLAAIGAWGGWMILPLVVFIGATVTLVVIGVSRLRGNAAPMDQPLPFGPGLCAAGFIALLLAPKILNAL